MIIKQQKSYIYMNFTYMLFSRSTVHDVCDKSTQPSYTQKDGAQWPKFRNMKTHSYLRKSNGFSNTADPTIRLFSHLIHFHHFLSGFLYNECLTIWAPFNKPCMVILYINSQRLVIFLIPDLSAPYQNSSIWNKWNIGLRGYVHILAVYTFSLCSSNFT
jgi:hypothetical protein